MRCHQVPRYGLWTTLTQHRPHRPSHCPGAWKHASSHPMKIMQKMGSWQNDHHAGNERCPMVNHADFGLLAPPIPDLRPVPWKKSLTPAVSSWGQSIWKEEKEMQLREEEYSEQLTLVDFYYQGVNMGKHQAISVVCPSLGGENCPVTQSDMAEHHWLCCIAGPSSDTI